jgi:hypothetical protein
MSQMTSALTHHAIPLEARAVSVIAALRHRLHDLRDRAGERLRGLWLRRAIVRRWTSSLFTERLFWVVFALLILLYVLVMFTQSRNFGPGG